MERTLPKGREVLFMSTCLCDAFFPEAAQASVEILEYLGCSVHFPADQTCCGQPAFNGGDWKSARAVIRHTTEVFAGNLPVVVPSGSCAHMIQHGMALAVENETGDSQTAVAGLAARTWELCDFLVNALGVTHWPGVCRRRVAFHRSCHTRGSNSVEAALRLLGSIDGLELAPFGETEQCCGFGGTFSVAFPNVSTAMGKLKLEHILEAQPDCLAAVDMACLLHLGGLLDRAGRTLPRMHAAQILRESLAASGLCPTVTIDAP